MCFSPLCRSKFVSSPLYIFNYVAYYFMLGNDSLIDGSYGFEIEPPILQTINLFQIRGDLYFQLLREWLQNCNQSHNCNRQIESQNWPTRLIFVGGPNPNKLKLQEHVSGK